MWWLEGLGWGREGEGIHGGCLGWGEEEVGKSKRPGWTARETCNWKWQEMRGTELPRGQKGASLRSRKRTTGKHEGKASREMWGWEVGRGGGALVPKSSRGERGGGHEGRGGKITPPAKERLLHSPSFISIAINNTFLRSCL